MIRKQPTRVQRLARVVLLVLALAGFLGMARALVRTPLQNDFVEYWAAARLLLTGGNPYSPPALLAAEAGGGATRTRALLMWNPPWTLPFILPLGILSYGMASLVWLLLSLAIVFACADFLWRLYGGNARRRWVGWLLAAIFFPLLTALGLGQIGQLILLGVTLFLRYHASRPLLAGAATILIAIKPQLLYLFWVVLLLESLRLRKWSWLAGGVGMLVLTSVLPLSLNPSLWRDYLELTVSGAVLRNPSPNLGTLLRIFLGDRSWLQFVPSLFGVAWLLFFWRSKRQAWTWQDQLPLVLLVSLVTTAYGWLFDQIVLLPAVMQIATPLASGTRRLRYQALAAYIGSSALMALFVAKRETGVAYAWTAPAWLLIYLWLRWQISAAQARSIPVCSSAAAN